MQVVLFGTLRFFLELVALRTAHRTCQTRLNSKSTNAIACPSFAKVSAALNRFSPEKCLFFVRHSLQDITVRGRVITNSNVLCYDNIPLCKELIWRSLGDAERHPGRVAILWLCFATLLRPLS